MGLTTVQKPHAVCVPYPAQGHITPMLRLAKLLYHNGFHITFVHNEYNRNRILRSYGPSALDGLPSFRFKAIPDGLPWVDADATQDIPSLCISTERHSLGPFKELLSDLSEEDGVPPVTCMLSDAAMFFTIDAAAEIGVPQVLLWTASACGFWGYAQYEKLLQLNIIPFKDANFLTNGDLDQVLDWIPGVENIRVKDMPTFLRTSSHEEPMLGYVVRLINKSKQAAGIVFNSYDALEHDVLPLIAANFPPLYNIGPLHLLLDPIEARNDETKSMMTSLWNEDPHCLEWLDSCEPNTVVYVNFGSIAVVTNDQLIEFAWGLANSKQPFLWIARPDLVVGDSAVLPPEFLEEIKGRGIISSWCNQDKVLGHKAVGGFLTHCGWNSILESISKGVPMVCWPFFAEQQTNSWFCCNKWGVGMEIDVNVKRREVERQVRELMEGDIRSEMKTRARELEELAKQATSGPHASAYVNLDNLIKLLLSHQ